MARKRTSTMTDQSEPAAPSRRRTTNSNGAFSHLPAENGANVEDEIRNLAYQKWQEAGCPDGDGVLFWLAAEAELQRR